LGKRHHAYSLRAILLGLAIILVVVRSFAAEELSSRLVKLSAATFNAAFTRVTVQDNEPFETLVWYPTNVPEVEWKAGPFPISATRGAPIVTGTRFPVVLLSHGHAGSPLNHRDLAAYLARSGYIVVAPTHVGDSAGQVEKGKSRQVLMDRPRQAKAALDAVLADERLGSHADFDRIGMIGYSAGGYTTLVMAGARPDFIHAMQYCRSHPEDIGSCGPKRNSDDDNLNIIDVLKKWRPVPEPRLKAMILLDPLAIFFDANSLASVHIPTLLVRPENDSYLKAAPSVALASGLPEPPQQIVVQGSHFVFIDPCPPAVAESAPEICKDEQGVDRRAIHTTLENKILTFLRAHL
jgi:predicted dienelactone hydrolase